MRGGQAVSKKATSTKATRTAAAGRQAPGGKAAGSGAPDSAGNGKGSHRGRLGGANGTNGEVGGGEPILHLRALANELNGVVAECLKDPGVEPVHHVRTGSRRVEAMLETVIRVSGGETAQNQLKDLSEKWFRQLGKIRRAAGKVRDLDVHRKLVDKHYLQAEGDSSHAHAPDGATGPENSDSADAPLHKQAQELDTWLKQHRDQQVAKLVKQLGKRQIKLIAAEQACIEEIAQKVSRSPRAGRPAVVLALEDFLRLVDAMPVLDADNLHDFRKGAKKARYVAETGGEDREAKAIAKAINRVQDAIGEWHDLLLLGEEAKTALGKGGAELREAIDSETERLFRSALRTTDTVRRRLVGEWMARGGKPGSRAFRTRPAGGQAGQPRPVTASQ